MQRVIFRDAGVEGRYGNVQFRSRGQRPQAEQSGKYGSATRHGVISPVLQTRFMLSVSMQLNALGGASKRM